MKKQRFDMVTVTEVLDCWSDFSMVTRAELKAAQIRGQVVHDLAHKYLAGTFVASIPAAYQGYWDSFRRWADAEVVDVLFLEERIFCDAYRFSGQLDIIARLRDFELPVVVDTKTAISAGKTWACQLCAYRWLAMTERGVITGAPAHLRTRKNGAKAIFRTVEDPHRPTEIFFKALELYHYFS
jgi:hypothetical protein